jgi:LuxR family maltose regulon positive regulatory protein
LSRTDLSLPIDRWRGRGRLLEVRFPELRFSFAEACDMLTRLVPNLAEDDLRDAATQSDGWAAGVQLSALAARSSFAQSDGRPPRVETNVLIEDYVRHEVLNAAGDVVS